MEKTLLPTPTSLAAPTKFPTMIESERARNVAEHVWSFFLFERKNTKTKNETKRNLTGLENAPVPFGEKLISVIFIFF